MAFANTRESSKEVELLRDIFSGCLRIDPRARISIATLCEILGNPGPRRLQETIPNSRMGTENMFKSERNHVNLSNQTTEAQFALKKPLDVFDVNSQLHFFTKPVLILLSGNHFNILMRSKNGLHEKS